MPEFAPTVSLSEAVKPLYAGLDVGGQSIKCGLVDSLGKTLAYEAIPTESQRGCEDAARRMGEALRRLCGEAGASLADVARVGLATPGTMDIPAGMILEPPNLPGWEHFPIRDAVAAACDKPVTYANDASAAAYGEYWVGAGAKFESMVLLTLGTGLGGGIIIGDNLIEGVHSHGAECGHLIIDYHEDARVCGCGGSGHLEAYASATALNKRTLEALEGDRPSSIRHRVAAGEQVSPLMLAEEAECGDGLAHDLIWDTAMYLGVGVVTLMHAIDPAGVVLGGAMTFGGQGSELGRRFLGRVKEEVKRRAFPVLSANTELCYASLGGDAGYLGVAGLARKAHRAE